MLRDLLDDLPALAGHIRDKLHESAMGKRIFPERARLDPGTACVLFLLGGCRREGLKRSCVIFNKRSLKVRQPGDLCFPGGRLAPRLDERLSILLKLPFSPLRKWPYRRQWLSFRGEETRQLALFLAAGLREALEEMRLNPLGVTFLGPMSALELTMFERKVYPLVAWIDRQSRFIPNWEVERIVSVPLQTFLDAGNYACYSVRILGATTNFPCFRYVDRGGSEILWGLTYDMVVSFLDLVFSFKPPELESLPVIHGILNEEYLKGAVFPEETP